MIDVEEDANIFPQNIGGLSAEGSQLGVFVKEGEKGGGHGGRADVRRDNPTEAGITSGDLRRSGLIRCNHLFQGCIDRCSACDVNISSIHIRIDQ